MRIATSRWNISTSRSNQGGQGSVLSQPIEEGRGDAIGQVGDDAGGRGQRESAIVDLSRIGGDDLEPARVERGDVAQAPAGSARPSRWRRRGPAPSSSSARVRPPGPGPISTMVAPSSGPAARAMRRVRLKSSRKFWPRLFLRREPEVADHLAERRQAVGRAHARASAFSLHGSGQAQRLDQAARACLAGAGETEGRAMVGRGAHEGKAERHVDALLEGERLERDERLVVIHADGRVVGRARAARGTGCRQDAAR